MDLDGQWVRENKCFKAPGIVWPKSLLRVPSESTIGWCLLFGTGHVMCTYDQSGRLNSPGPFQGCKSFLCGLFNFVMTRHYLLFFWISSVVALPSSAQMARSQCNVNCTCGGEAYNPVCGSDGLMYVSPCYAGCEEVRESGDRAEEKVH